MYPIKVDWKMKLYWQKLEVLILKLTFFVKTTRLTNSAGTVGVVVSIGGVVVFFVIK